MELRGTVAIVTEDNKGFGTVIAMRMVQATNSLARQDSKWITSTVATDICALHKVINTMKEV